MASIIKPTLCALMLLSASITGSQLHHVQTKSSSRELNGPFFFNEQDPKQQLSVQVEEKPEQQVEEQQEQTQQEGKEQRQQNQEVEQKRQESEEMTDAKDTELNSTLAMLKNDAKADSLASQGLSFTVGLQVNTTKNGYINKRAIGEDLSAELYTYLWNELPNRYQINQVTIIDVQHLSLELVRKLRKLKSTIQTHEFVVLGKAEFLTDEIPPASEINELILNMKLSPVSFHNSTNPIFGARFFELRTSASALEAPENEPVEPSVFVDYSTLVYLGSCLALLNVLAAVSYFAKSRKSMKVNEVVSSDDTSLKVVEDESKDDDEFPVDKSLVGNGVLFVDSGSASCSDDSLIEERGLADTFSVYLPNRGVVRKVVDEFADDTFTCGFEVPAPSQRREKKARPLDIDSVMCDSDSEYEERRKKRDYKLKAKVVNEVIDNGLSCGFEVPARPSCGFEVPARPLDIDSVMYDDDDSEYKQRRNGSSGKTRNLQGDRSVLLVPRVQKGSKSSRRMYCDKKSRQQNEKPSNSDIFAVVTDEDVEEGCVMVSPQQFVKDVVDEAIVESYDCGLSLAGY